MQRKGKILENSFDCRRLETGRLARCCARLFWFSSHPCRRAARAVGGVSRPEMMLSIVVLPQPDGPSNAYVLPSSKCMSSFPARRRPCVGMTNLSKCIEAISFSLPAHAEVRLPIGGEGEQPLRCKRQTDLRSICHLMNALELHHRLAERVSTCTNVSDPIPPRM